MRVYVLSAYVFPLGGLLVVVVGVPLLFGSCVYHPPPGMSKAVQGPTMTKGGGSVPD